MEQILHQLSLIKSEDYTQWKKKKSEHNTVLKVFSIKPVWMFFCLRNSILSCTLPAYFDFAIIDKKKEFQKCFFP